MLTSPTAAVILLLLFWAALAASLRDKSLTFDEGAYAVAGCSAWRLGDYRLNPEAGSLPQRVAGLPLALGPYKLPSAASDAWHGARVPELGYAFFYESGNDARKMAALGRAACGLMAVLLGGLVWAWSRKLFGPVAGMISLALYILNPTVLANGALMTSDMAAALFFAAATWSWWLVLERVSPARLLGSALLTGCLFVSKMSAVLMLPVMAILALARAWDKRPLPVSFRRREWALWTRGRRMLVLGVAGIVLAAVVIGVIWSFYGFRFGASPQPAAGDQFQFPWDYVLSGGHPAAAATLPPTLPLRAVDFMRRHELLPESWIYGLGIILNRTQFGTAFWNGSYSTTGWPGFLPYTFLVKTPLGVFAVFALALAGGLSARGFGRTTLPLWTFLAVYGLAAVNSHLDIGHRYLLPVYAPVFVLCGASAYWIGRPWARAIIPALLILLAAETACRFPNYLSYFNGIVRSGEAYRHLVDSSLDWGQDLPAVREYIDANPQAGPFYLSYFGAASPDYYGVNARPLYSFGARYLAGFRDLIVVNLPQEGLPDALAQLERKEPTYDLMGLGGTEARPFAVLLKKPRELRLSGGTYLISATMLQSVCDWNVHGPWNARYEAAYRKLAQDAGSLVTGDLETRRKTVGERNVADSQWLLYQFEQYRLARLAAYLRGRRPDTTLNGSILVYRLTDGDLAKGLGGPWPEAPPGFEKDRY